MSFFIYHSPPDNYNLLKKAITHQRVIPAM